MRPEGKPRWGIAPKRSTPSWPTAASAKARMASPKAITRQTRIPSPQPVLEVLGRGLLLELLHRQHERVPLLLLLEHLA